MEEGTMSVESGQRIGAWYEREVMPWKEPPRKDGEKNTWDKMRLFSGWMRCKLEVRRCPKCKLVLFGY